MPVENERDALQTGTFCRNFGAVADYILSGLTAMEKDQALLDPATPLSQAIRRFRNNLEKNPLTNRDTLSEARHKGAESREKIAKEAHKKANRDEILWVTSDPHYQYKMGYYAQAALRVYSAAKTISESPEAQNSRVVKNAATYCQAMERNKKTLDTLRTLAMAHAETYGTLSPEAKTLSPPIAPLEISGAGQFDTPASKKSSHPKGSSL